MILIALVLMLSSASLVSAQDWQPAAAGGLPQWPTPAGYEADGTPLYIARAPFNGGVQIGKVNPTHAGAYIPWGGVESSVSAFEVYCGSGTWVPATAAALPPGAIPGGKEADGTPLYIIRAPLGNGVHPGKLNPANGRGYVSYGGREVEVTSGLEAFTGSGDWVAAADGEVPFGAIKGGYDDDGSPLFIIRARYHGGTHLGKMNPASGKAYIPYEGQEIEVVAYEVLVYHFGPQG